MIAIFPSLGPGSLHVGAAFEMASLMADPLAVSHLFSVLVPPWRQKMLISVEAARPFTVEQNRHNAKGLFVSDGGTCNL